MRTGKMRVSARHENRESLIRFYDAAATGNDAVFAPARLAMQSTSSVSNLLAFFSLDRPNSSPLLAPGRGVEQYIDPDVLFGPGGRRPLKTSKEKV